MCTQENMSTNITYNVQKKANCFHQESNPRCMPPESCVPLNYSKHSLRVLRVRPWSSISVTRRNQSPNSNVNQPLLSSHEMDLLGSNMSSEAGLRLLLYPLGSNVVVRTACCSVGIVLPVYSTFKAIETNDQNEQKRWLFYWAAYGSFSMAEVFTDKLISWFPLYYHMKFAFLVWLQLPTTDGAKQLYMNHLRPFLLRHQAKLDQIVGFVYSESGKFIVAHQAEFQFARAIVRKILVTVKDIVKDCSEPVQSQERRATRGPRRLTEMPVDTSDSVAEGTSDSGNDSGKDE